MPERTYYRMGAIAAIAGALPLFVGTFLHTLDADPNDPLAAFIEYAADRLWVANHLMQLMGVLCGVWLRRRFLLSAALLTIQPRRELQKPSAREEQG